MTATKRSAVLARILAQSSADALPAIRTYLRESPATYAQLVEGAQIAQAWHRSVGSDGDEAWTRWPLVVRMDREGRVEQHEAVCHVSRDTPSAPWLAFVFGHETGESFLDPSEARDAADASVQEVGWTLLGGGW